MDFSLFFGKRNTGHFRYFSVISKMIIQGPLKLSGIFMNMVLIYQHVNVY